MPCLSSNREPVPEILVAAAQSLSDTVGTLTRSDRPRPVLAGDPEE